MHSPNEIIEIYKFIEENYDLSKFNYRGINFWPLIRKEAAYNLYKPKAKDEKGLYLGNQTFSDIVKYPYRVLKGLYLKQMFLRNLKPLVSEVQFCTNPESLFVDRMDGKAYSRYIDPYYEIIAQEYPLINRVSFSRNPGSGVDHFYSFERYEPDAFFKYRDFKNYFDSLDSTFIEETKKMYKSFDELNALIETKFKVSLFYHNLVKSFISVINYKTYFDCLFKKSTVKLIFINCYYDSLKMGLCAAAKDNSIKIVEIQHGVINDNAYIPFINHSENYTILPDYFWCWSPGDVDLIRNENKSLKYLKPFLGGNMWLKKFVNHEISLPSDQEMDFLNSIKKEYSKIILITLQHIFILNEVIIECIKKAPSDYLFLIRFHPFNSDKEKKDFKETIENQKNVEYDFSSSINLYYLFERCDFQLTHSSATGIEALSFNLPTVICSKYGRDFYKDQIDSGVVLFSENSDEILGIIRGNKSEFNEKTEFFKMCVDPKIAVENMKKVMHEDLKN